MSKAQKKPDRGNGPAPNDIGEDANPDANRSPSGRWVRAGKWIRDLDTKTKSHRGRVYRCKPGIESIRIDHIIVRGHRLEAWVELRASSDKVPLVCGRCDDMAALEAYKPFIPQVANTAVPWEAGLRLAFYEALIDWRDDLLDHSKA